MMEQRNSLLRILLLWLAIGVNSCTTTESIQTPKIQDLRVELTHCPVHGEPLIETSTTVDMERGITYFKIRDELFPLAYDDPAGDGTPALVTYCPKCRAAKQQYLQDGRSLQLPSTDQEENIRRLEEFIEQQRQKLDANYP